MRINMMIMTGNLELFPPKTEQKLFYQEFNENNLKQFIVLKTAINPGHNYHTLVI